MSEPTHAGAIVARIVAANRAHAAAQRPATDDTPAAEVVAGPLTPTDGLAAFRAARLADEQARDAALAEQRAASLARQRDRLRATDPAA